MTVCVTGDVHHMSLETRDQACMDRSEIDVALDYVEIAAEHDLPVTLFVTGKAVSEERGKLERLAEKENVEVGGHNFYAFDTPVHQGWRALEKVTGGRLGSWNGPKPFQRWEIEKTIRRLETLDIEVDSWRDHAYRHDSHTASLLASHGITHFSDAVGPDKQVHALDDLTVVPVNTPPDHEHVYHAFRTPDYVSTDDFEGPFGAGSTEVEEWASEVLRCVDEIEHRGGVATILAHPSCMWLADGLDTFRSLCEQLSSNQCVKMRSV